VLPVEREFDQRRAQQHEGGGSSSSSSSSEQQPQQQQPAPHGHALGSPGIGGLAQAPGEYTDEEYTAALLEGTMEAWKLCGFSAVDWEKLLLKEQLVELLVATVDWEKLVEETVFRL
jgi:hypothetical protein